MSFNALQTARFKTRWRSYSKFSKLRPMVNCSPLRRVGLFFIKINY
ncbi:hypothetical protein HMPREF9554_00460 [Treponema phagedenis F0421]|nr:hypothetical protein HMPREF9554_00460 [Treponema phagedenis F0421]